MDPYYSSSSDDEAPEAVGLSTAKAASKQLLQQERAAAKTAKDAKKAANRKRDEALKAQKADRSKAATVKNVKSKPVSQEAPVGSSGSEEEEEQSVDDESSDDEGALPAALVQQLAARDAEEEDADDDNSSARQSRKRPSNLTTFDSDDEEELNYSTAKSIASELDYLYGREADSSVSEGASDDEEMGDGQMDKTLGGHIKVVALNKQTAPPAPSSSALAFAKRHLAKKSRRAPVAKNLTQNLMGQPALNFKHKAGSTNKSGKTLTKPSAKRRRVQ